MSSSRCVFLMGVEQALEYRASFFLSMLSAVFPIIIQTTMWNYLYRHSDAVAVFGYQQGEILLYTLLATIVSQLVGTGFEGEMNSDIKMGGLNKYLIRPVAYKGYQFFRFLGQKVPRVMVVAPVMAVIVVFAFFQGLPISIGRVAAFMVSLCLALVLNFSIFYCIGLLVFLLKDVVELIVNVLPFGYTAQFPVNIINGRFGWERMGVGFAFQAGWIVFFVCLGNLMWKHGVKRYAAVGG